MIDVLYVVRPGVTNQELRFSLRTLSAHVPHDRVVIAGSCPRWVRNVETVPAPRQPNKYVQTTVNMVAAFDVAITGDFLFMHDDMFVMAPVDRVPPMHRGPIEDVARSHQTLSYAGKMRTAGKWLRDHGFTDLCYATHAPIVLNADAMREVLKLPVPPEALHTHKRIVYGNVMGIGGELSREFKVWGGTGGDWETWPYLSTTDASFAHAPVGRLIRSRFPDPCRYEAEG